MQLRHALPILVALGSLGSLAPSLMLAGRLLVPSTLTWKQAGVFAAFVVVISIPLLALYIPGVSSALIWWQDLLWFGIAFWAPVTFGAWYFNSRVRAPDGEALGLRRGAELSIWATCIAMTLGLGVVGLLLSQ